jgi:hypothetical protein
MRPGRTWRAWLLAPLAMLFVIEATTPAQAGWPFRKRVRVETQQVVTTPAFSPSTPPAGSVETPMLGSFYPTPYMTVRGNAPSGGGYSPLGTYGEQNLAYYGPMSPLRAKAAPVVLYQRGYDGRLIPQEATGFSYPYLPPAASVIYPTRGNYYYGFRESGTPPWWNDGSNWVDLN